MHELIKEAVMKRFDVLSAKVEKLKECAALREQAGGIEQILMGKIPESEKLLFNEWLDLQVQIVALQEQWLYVKGLQDGIQLLMFLLLRLPCR
jgi:hypothetical protein